MDHGNISFHIDHKEGSSSDSKPLQAGNPSLNVEASPSSINNVGVQTEQLPVPPHTGLLVKEKDLFMPISNLMRIMWCILPPHAKVSKEAKEIMQECVSEFISFITSEANDRCQKEYRKIVTAEDILSAMETLGFNNYVEPLAIYLKRYRQREVGNLWYHGGHIPMQSVVPSYHLPPPLPPQPLGASFRPNFPDGPSMYQGMFDSTSMHRLFQDGLGSSGSGISVTMTNFDPIGIPKNA